jgi:hypothetical protein
LHRVTLTNDALRKRFLLGRCYAATKKLVIPSESRGIRSVTLKVPQRDPSTLFGMQSNHSAKIRTTLSSIGAHWGDFYHILRVVID